MTEPSTEAGSTATNLPAAPPAAASGADAATAGAKAVEAEVMPPQRHPCGHPAPGNTSGVSLPILKFLVPQAPMLILLQCGTCGRIVGCGLERQEEPRIVTASGKVPRND